MSVQQHDEIVRHEDGAIDVRFYARRGIELRRAARAEFMAGLLTTSRDVSLRWTGAARSFGRNQFSRLRHIRWWPSPTR